MGLFDNVEMAPADPILGISTAFNACDNPKKVNLGVGAYRDENGKPWVLPTVRAAEEKLLQMQEQGKANHEYLGIDGIPEFYNAAVKLMLGDDCQPLKDGKLCTVQCLSGTGALRLGASVMQQFMPQSAIYIPNPTWGNHKKIFPRDGVQVKEYTYYDPATCGLNFAGMCADLKAMPPNSVVLLHACAHNPTGVDPTQDQWKEIANIMKAGKLVPMLDSAYQGFASGDFDKDAWPCRLFASEGFEMMLCQSFAKNMGLYGERTGAFTIICETKDIAVKMMSQIKPFIRTMYSSPPGHGAKIANIILNDPVTLAAWKAEVKSMADRIIQMRVELLAALTSIACPPPKGVANWTHVTSQIGMFTFTGLTEPQCKVLTEKYFIFLTMDGRVSMAGLNSEKCKYLAEAMKDAIESA